MGNQYSLSTQSWECFKCHRNRGAISRIHANLTVFQIDITDLSSVQLLLSMCEIGVSFDSLTKEGILVSLIFSLQSLKLDNITFSLQLKPGFFSTPMGEFTYKS